MRTARTEVMSFMSDRTLWLLATVSRTWPWEERALMAERLGKHVAWARDEGFSRFVLVHGAYGLDPLGHYKHDPPRSDSMARSIWVGDWGFPDDPRFADFGTYGKAAGPIRNADMVQSIVKRLTQNPSDAARCEAFIVADSRGATGTADLAERAGILTKRNHLGKVARPALRKRAPRMVVVPGQKRVVRVKPARPGAPEAHVVPSDVPGPCGRCGRMSYLATDNVLYHGDGHCVYWDEERSVWRQGCGSYHALRHPASVAAGSLVSPPAVLPVVQAEAGRTALSA